MVFHVFPKDPEPRILPTFFSLTFFSRSFRVFLRTPFFPLFFLPRTQKGYSSSHPLFTVFFCRSRSDPPWSLFSFVMVFFFFLCVHPPSPSGAGSVSGGLSASRPPLICFRKRVTYPFRINDLSQTSSPLRVPLPPGTFFPFGKFLFHPPPVAGASRSLSPT